MSISILSTKYIIRTTKEEEELGGADGVYGTGANWTKLCPDNITGRNYCEDLRSDGKIKLKGSLKMVKVQVKLTGYDMKAHKKQKGYSPTHVSHQTLDGASFSTSRPDLFTQGKSPR